MQDFFAGAKMPVLAERHVMTSQSPKNANNDPADERNAARLDATALLIAWEKHINSMAAGRIPDQTAKTADRS